jgi:hypothetical protein
MTELLSNYVAGRWQSGSGAGTPLFDPVLGTELVRVDAAGLDLPAAFALRANRAATRCAPSPTANAPACSARS